MGEVFFFLTLSVFGQEQGGGVGGGGQVREEMGMELGGGGEKREQK